MPLTSSWAHGLPMAEPSGKVCTGAREPTPRSAAPCPDLPGSGLLRGSWCQFLAPRHRPRTPPVLSRHGLMGLVPQQQAQPAPLEPVTRWGRGWLCSQLEGGRGACLGRVLQRRL